MILVLLLCGCVTPAPQDNGTINDTTNGTGNGDITTFEECVAAGNPIMESYPRQCRAGGKTFISLSDLFDVSKNTSCSADDECRLVNSELAFSCCWAGACEPMDYSLERWIAVNAQWYEGQREQHCPADCGPAPMCAVRVVNDNYTAICQEGICEKTAIMAVNLTANNITLNDTEINETNQSKEEIEETQEEPKSFPIGGYRLVLDDVVITPESCGAFSITDHEGTVLDKLLICEKESQYWISPEGHRYRILVVKVAAGYTFEGNWADVRVYG